jgi:hypothetical protein
MWLPPKSETMIVQACFFHMLVASYLLVFGSENELLCVDHFLYQTAAFSVSTLSKTREGMEHGDLVASIQITRTQKRNGVFFNRKTKTLVGGGGVAKGVCIE